MCVFTDREGKLYFHRCLFVFIRGFAYYGGGGLPTGGLCLRDLCLRVLCPGGLHPVGSQSRGCLEGHTRSHWQPLQQSVCILLECILVLKFLNFFEMTNAERFQGHNSYSVMI